MTASDCRIVVWERSNKLGKWCPYSSKVCQLLEESLANDLLTVCLGDAHEEMDLYSINLKEMVQVSKVTGTKSPIRRRLYDTVCVLGRGYTWQWFDDHDVWNIYDVDVNNFIDTAFLEGKKSISLSKKFPGYNYEIVFAKLIQVNKHSKRKRKIRRQENASPYPVVTCSDNPQNSDDIKQTDTSIGIQKMLNPAFLAEEIPGTTALINQVNAYKRNVESPTYDNTMSSINLTQEESAHSSRCKHPKVSSADEEQEKISDPERSSTYSTTVALVGGRPWTDSRPPHTPHSLIKPVPGIDPLPKFVKPKKSKRKGAIANSNHKVVNVLEEYTEVVDISPEASEEPCIICCESLSSNSSYNEDSTVSKLTLCSHRFHKACLEAMYNSGNKEFLQCPSCKKIHGEKCGIQPPGEMIYHVLPYSLPGYSENDTIRIIYDIHSGIQGSEHPNPGKRFTARGFPRHCYLPDNEMGRKILRLLIKAWKRRLIFTIGRSSTTGEEDTVTWNEIHHKTEFGCNRRGHGYPDENYFINVLAELEAHGIIDDEVRVWYPV